MSKNINSRFSYFESCGYSVELISLIGYYSKEECLDIENALQDVFCNYKTTPPINFNGKTECFIEQTGLELVSLQNNKMKPF